LNRESLIQELVVYDSGFAEEKLFTKRFMKLLQHPDAFERHHLPGHITGSSWIIDHSRQLVLLIHHGTLNRWLQPGGHADGEENVVNVALREAEEETGVKHFQLLQKKIFDLDIHPIPARGNFPDHLHYDIRFLFQADKTEKLIVSDESHDVAWIAIDRLGDLTNNNHSIMRMAKKVLTLKA
jgi:8-oxo-dGTP pyrophosphatase MutT (NUDIX family)